MFAGQQQVFAGTSEVEVGIAEGMDVPRTAQSLPGSEAGGRVFAGVMDEDDGEIELPL